MPASIIGFNVIETPQSGTGAIHYRIVPADRHAHRFEVRCTVTKPDPAGQAFRLPSWIPGSYLIREFARHVVAIRAERAGAAVPIVKEAKDCWRAAPGPGEITVVTEVFAFDLSVRGAWLDLARGFFNGACVFLCPDGFEASPCIVEIAAPDDPETAGWHVETALALDTGRQDPLAQTRGFTRYRAADYGELIDHPVAFGRFGIAEFVAGGVPHRIAVSGARNAAIDRIANDLARVCSWQIELFGGAGARPPFERYLFLVQATARSHGGLEHRASASLICARDELPDGAAPAGTAAPPGTAATDAAAIGDRYLRFLGLASHEYFHAWNVKRIKPAAFVPYDLGREAYSRQLWIFEGITSYYDDLALLRCSLIDAARYLELIGRNISTLLRTPGRGVQSLGEASFDAWIKHYRPDCDSPNATVSYYLKGSLVALTLDLTLRREGRASLDDVMRTLWTRYGMTATGVPEGGFRGIVDELAGHPFAPFFAAYVDGTLELPLADILGEFAVDLELRSATGATDKGGKRACGPRARSWLGASLDAGLALRHAFSGGPAERAGLAPGDTLVAFDGIKASAESLTALTERRAPGDEVEVHAFRDDELRTYRVVLGVPPLDTACLALRAEAGAAALALRRAWLGA